MSPTAKVAFTLPEIDLAAENLTVEALEQAQRLSAPRPDPATVPVRSWSSATKGQGSIAGAKPPTPVDSTF
jgi:hypothetical protein